MQKLTMPADISVVPVKFVIITLDSHLVGALNRALPTLRAAVPGLELSLHAAAEWADNPQSLERCRADIASADFIVATMLFMEDHIQAVLPWLEARSPECDAIVGGMSAGEIIRLTRLGEFRMDKPERGAMALLKKLRGSKKKGTSIGAQQVAMLKRIPKILRFIPGMAQDVRSYFLALQYCMAGTAENIANLVLFLIDRYGRRDRSALRGKLKVSLPLEYPEVGIYHPRLTKRVTTHVHELPSPEKPSRGTVGLLVMRSQILAGDTAHYDGVIAAIEKRGLQVIPAFATGLDARPAIKAFFQGSHAIDALVSLTGFSLVGGPAYNDSKAAEDVLGDLDIPYLAAQPLEFQTLEQWGASDRGLHPVEATMMVAIPEIDGATGPIVFGGRSDGSGRPCQGCNVGCTFSVNDDARRMHVCAERAEMIASRVSKLVELKKASRRDRKLAIVLFNFPPNGGATGTAAHLAVFESLWNTLKGLARAGYQVELPANVDALRSAIIEGNASTYGMPANVLARVPTDSHIRREAWLDELEKQWGPAPGKHQADGRSISILGCRFGNIVVGVQPAFGYEGDPMRLLFEKSFAPTHAFAAFYRYLREDFGAHAYLHFGTHGALEFMPGKQTGLSASSWSDRLIGDTPNFYLYAANNPSEGTIAKRRSAATIITYLTPPVAHAGLYRGLIDLKSSLDRWRSLSPEEANEKTGLAELIQSQAAALDLVAAEPAWPRDPSAEIVRLQNEITELEQTLIPQGLHVVGEPASLEERTSLLSAIAESSLGIELPAAAATALATGSSPEAALRAGELSRSSAHLEMFKQLADTNRLLSQDHEIAGIIAALDGKFVRPVPGGDLLRSPQILPTGRNLHAFDPFRIPSAFAIADGARQADRLLHRHHKETGSLPESIAIVLWGTDNLKSEGGPIAQALALIGAKPRFDGYGRLTGAALIPLAELGRPRVDVLMTLSGIFRDLLPLQTKLLAEAAFLAAKADEASEQNFVRKHALDYQLQNGCDLETAALRVFSNADSAYGSNVNHLIDSGHWTDENDLAETFAKRKCFAYGCSGGPVQHAQLFNSILADVDLAYQNLESVELGVTTVDHYFDNLGGVSRAIRRAKGDAIPVYIGDQTRGEGQVRTLAEQVALETRTRMLNPKWYEAMLKHGYEGVRQIEAHITNTVGWSATTSQVAPWIYQRLAQTFVLDDAMRQRLAELNPTASAKVANRLLEAQERNYWAPDSETLEALRKASEELEDRVEGVGLEVAA
ncbi:magnesium chelatase subunit H [Hyphomicrobium sp.]|uniref:magnesium chelatase subunit H n=1 Tax=Hyphomicrobium sp. TaxID=82 RepID=UPI000F989F63|nr:magnesium chelatase subunit H [Hyphomicrobium sp.]RUP00717.1 MAG: magnesium chelatase subunit H [Hyphomicrobium sp.]